MLNAADYHTHGAAHWGDTDSFTFKTEYLVQNRSRGPAWRWRWEPAADANQAAEAWLLQLAVPVFLLFLG